MFVSISPLALLLLPLFAAVSNATTYYSGDDLSLTWTASTDFMTAPAVTEANCEFNTGDFEALGYHYNSATGECYLYFAYPYVCSGMGPRAGFVEGILYDRCSGTPGYVEAGDSSCIYTGGAVLTDAAYEEACPTAGSAPAPLVSPAYRRKRRVVEQSPFVGGKTCPIGEQACPLASTNAFECINVKENLASCGGCLVGLGVDCSDLPGTNEVSCKNGSCVVDSCARGWSLSSSKECVKA